MFNFRLYFDTTAKTGKLAMRLVNFNAKDGLHKSTMQQTEIERSRNKVNFGFYSTDASKYLFKDKTDSN